MENQSQLLEVQKITPQKKVEILRSFFVQGLTGSLDLGNKLEIQKIKNRYGISVYKVGDWEDSYNIIGEIKSKTLESIFILNPKEDDEKMMNDAIFILSNFPDSKLVVILGDIVNAKNHINFSGRFEKIKYLLKKFKKQWGKINHLNTFENFRGYQIGKDEDINNIYDKNYYENHKLIKRRGDEYDNLATLFFSKNFRNNANSSLYTEFSDKILALGIFDPSIKYSKSELYKLYDNLTSQQKSKIEPILRQTEIAFQRPQNSKSTLNFLIRHKKEIPEIAKGKYFGGIYCDFDGTLFEDSMPGSQITDPKIKQNTLNYLKQQQQKGIKVTIMTGGDLNQRKEVLKKNGLDFDIVHKSQLAGSIINTIIDDTPNAKVFHSITKIAAVNYIQVDQIK